MILDVFWQAHRVALLLVRLPSLDLLPDATVVYLFAALSVSIQT